MRAAALHHATSWEALVPNAFEINLKAEEAEEAAEEPGSEADETTEPKADEASA